MKLTLVSLQTSKDNLNEELKSGFNFIMDYNEDRQVIVDKALHGRKNKIGLAGSIVDFYHDNEKNAFIILDTIGKLEERSHNSLFIKICVKK